MKLAHLKYASWFFLAIPYVIFLIGWLKPIVAIPLGVGVVWLLWNVVGEIEGDEIVETKDAIYAILLTLPVLFFSGISGHAFQNWDFHGRNAVFHDLIAYSWPVFYPTSTLTGEPLIMSYYIGYWLPSALLGKLFGWEIANLSLYFWSLLGIFLTVSLLSIRLRISLVKTCLLFFAFSGMDVIGVGVNRILGRPLYPGLWPPVQHLEWWSMPVEISSILTQIYWVFNQAIPLLLAMALWLNGIPKRHLAFIWSLTFFLAPLPSIGLLIFFIVDILSNDTSRLGVNLSIFQRISRSISFTALGGAIIFGIGFLYFSTNLAAKEKSLQSLPPLFHLMFFLLEGGLLWIILFPKKYQDPFWITTGAILFFAVFFRIGNHQDFVMRATIAALLYLLVGVGEEIFHYQGWKSKLILAILFIGSITPFYEVNRSVARTLNYYFNLNIPVTSSLFISNPNYLAIIPELDHPDSISADAFKTLNTNNSAFDWRDNFLGEYGDNFFTKWLMK